MTMLHLELHGSGVRNDLLYLTEIDQESTMTAHNHRIILQIVLHLFGSGAKHIGTYFPFTQMAYLYVIANSLNI